MHRIALIALLACSFAVAQTTPAPKTTPPAKSQGAASSQPSASTAQKPAASGEKAATKTEPAKEVPENAAVITINNVCEKPSANGECKTVITRSEFERLTNAVNPSNGLNPPLPPDAKRQIATRYSQFLAFADQAKKEKLDETPRAKELKQFAELQALAQLYMSSLQEKSVPTPAEIQKYYDDNKARFEKMTVLRVLVPANPGPEAKDVTADKLKETAQKLYDRAKAGEDFNKLQKEAFTTAGLNSSPDAKMVLNPASLPPQQQAVRQLKPGELSQLYTEVSGEYFYKMEGTEATPLDKVRPDIEKALQRQKFQDTVNKMVQDVKPDLNEAYFGAAPKAAAGVERD